MQKVTQVKSFGTHWYHNSAIEQLIMKTGINSTIYRARQVCSSLRMEIPPLFTIPECLFSFPVPSYRRAITRTRLNALPSVISEGHILDILFSDRYCGCSLGIIETAEHVLFECPWYKEARKKLIKPLTGR